MLSNAAASKLRPVGHIQRLLFPSACLLVLFILLGNIGKATTTALGKVRGGRPLGWHPAPAMSPCHVPFWSHSNMCWQCVCVQTPPAACLCERPHRGPPPHSTSVVIRTSPPIMVGPPLHTVESKTEWHLHIYSWVSEHAYYSGPDLMRVELSKCSRRQPPTMVNRIKPGMVGKNKEPCR